MHTIFIPEDVGTYMYLHEWLIFVMVNVGKYTVRPMDPSWDIEYLECCLSQDASGKWKFKGVPDPTWCNTKPCGHWNPGGSIPIFTYIDRKNQPKVIKDRWIH